jgi:hypothetical protein
MWPYLGLPRAEEMVQAFCGPTRGYEALRASHTFASVSHFLDLKGELRLPAPPC